MHLGLLYFAQQQYRLHIISLTGIDKYSQVVIVNTSKSGIYVNVYPNPVSNGTLGLQFNNLSADVYTVSIYNMLSQRLLDHVINHPGGSNNISIKLNSVIIPGTYELVISGAKGSSYKQKFIVE